MREEFLTLLQGENFVDKRESRRVSNGGRHRWWQFERGFPERRELVHEAQRTAAENASFSSLKRLGHEERNAVIDRQGFNARRSEHRLY